MSAPSSPQFRPSTKLNAVPTPFWVGLGIAAITFVFHLSTKTVVVDGSGYSCEYHDYAGFIGAALIVVCVIAGWAGRKQLHAARRLALPLMYGATAVLLALALLHVLRGVGTIGSACDGHPLP